MALYHKLNNFYQSLKFLLKLFKTEGLILRIYWSSHRRCFGKNVFLEIAVAILKNFLKITVKLPCESGQNTWKIYVKKSSFSKFAGFQRVTWLKMNYFTNIVQEFCSYIPEHLFFKHVSQAAYLYMHSLQTNYNFTISVFHCPNLKTTSKIIPLNQRKFQILNQNKEARGQLVG